MTIWRKLPAFWRQRLGRLLVIVRPYSDVSILSPEEQYSRFGWVVETEQYGSISVQLVPYGSSRTFIEDYIGEHLSRLTKHEAARYLDLCLGATRAAQLLHEKQQCAVRAWEKRDNGYALVHLKFSLLMEERLANNGKTTMDLFCAMFDLPVTEGSP